MIEKISRYFYTVKYLKFKQIRYRIYYYIRNKYRNVTGFTYNFHVDKKSAGLHFEDSIQHNHSLDGDTFTFLNLSKTFSDAIDWNFSEYGKLWTYNINYFDYILQKDVDTERGLKLINDFIRNIKKNKVGLEAYPTSIRCINWIKFLTKHEIKDKDVALYAQYSILSDNLEYHLLGNHLLENACSLLFGAYYFNDYFLYKKAKTILLNELNEQILNDGGHFELSPMYHQLILLKVLDCVNVIKNNNLFNRELINILKEKAIKMLQWSNEITFDNGNIPLFNDSVNKIAPTTKQLNEYARRLGVVDMPLPDAYCLKESGYRKIKKSRYEMVVDIGKIGPDYIPGHAHCDALSFELYVDKKPLIVDTGISTYEANELRLHQKKTSSHNTVGVDNYEQSEMWGSFRVARRAFVKNVKECGGKISAIQNGYKKIGAIHERSFEFFGDKIIIHDFIISQNNYRCFSYLHFHPDVEVQLKGNVVIVNNIPIIIKKADNIEIQIYNYAPEFNKLIPSRMIVSQFYRSLTTEVVL